jgi:predicted nucleic acid-binding protein
MSAKAFLDINISLIIASALEVGCDRLYSEDLQDGQKIDSTILLINPFRGRS